MISQLPPDFFWVSLCQAEPSPTTGITQPIPLFHSIAASKVGAEAAERKVWRAQPSTLGSEKVRLHPTWLCFTSYQLQD